MLEVSQKSMEKSVSSALGQLFILCLLLMCSFLLLTVIGATGERYFLWFCLSSWTYVVYVRLGLEASNVRNVIYSFIAKPILIGQVIIAVCSWAMRQCSMETHYRPGMFASLCAPCSQLFAFRVVLILVTISILFLASPMWRTTHRLL